MPAILLYDRAVARRTIRYPATIADDVRQHIEQSGSLKRLRVKRDKRSLSWAFRVERVRVSEF
jgi:hypothetical protein